MSFRRSFVSFLVDADEKRLGFHFESNESVSKSPPGSWESVVDTAGLLCLLESYTWHRSEWKAVELLERFAFVAGMLVTHQLGPAAAQLMVGAITLAVFQVRTN